MERRLPLPLDSRGALFVGAMVTLHSASGRSVSRALGLLAFVLAAGCGPANPPNPKLADVAMANRQRPAIPEEDLGTFEAVPSEPKKVAPVKGEKRERSRRLVIKTPLRDLKRELSWFEEILALKKDGSVSKLRVIIGKDEMTPPPAAAPTADAAKPAAPASKPGEAGPGPLDAKGATLAEGDGTSWMAVDERGKPDPAEDSKLVAEGIGTRDDFDPVFARIPAKLLNPQDEVPELVPAVSDLCRRRFLEGVGIERIKVVYKGVRAEAMVFELEVDLTSKAEDAKVAKLKGALVVDKTTGTTVLFQLGGVLEMPPKTPSDPVPPFGEIHIHEETTRAIKKK